MTCVAYRSALRRGIPRCLYVALGTGLILIALNLLVGERMLVYNNSPSVPIGLYRRQPGAKIRVGGLVDFPIPEAAKDYVAGRAGRLGDWHILKPVVAVAGDHVCTESDDLSINGKRLGPIIEHDSRGNLVPVWRDCRRLVEGELFVFSTRIERSFDSRVYGPIQATDVTGVYAPLWVDRSKPVDTSQSSDTTKARSPMGSDPFAPQRDIPMKNPRGSTGRNHTNHWRIR